jgi:hypothetical protein
MYKWFKDWTAQRPKSDLWRAGIGIIVIALLLFLLTGCGTTGPSMTLATSHRGDGFIQVKQPLYQAENYELFVDYVHHSEIFREDIEDTYDGVRFGMTWNFGKWKWQE